MIKNLSIASAVFTSILFFFVGYISADTYNFSKDLMVGSNGPDVSALQSFLIENGFDIPAISSGAVSKGYFGAQTKVALVKYQKSVELPAFGYFGSLTRSKIRSGPVASAFNLISPKGGEKWVKGTTQAIRWNSPAFIRATYVDIKLSSYIDNTPCPVGYSCTLNPNVAVNNYYTIAKNISIENRTYNWNVGSYVDVVNGLPVSGSIRDGQYTLSVCQSGTNVCISTKNPINILSTRVNDPKAPNINGVEAPTSLSVGETGTWKFKVTDPQNGTINYSIEWGDDPVYPTSGLMVPIAPTIQNTTFTHQYTKPGTYTIKFTANNSYGENSITTTVNVTQSNNINQFRIVTPKDNDAWEIGSVKNITWDGDFGYDTEYGDITITSYNSLCAQGVPCTPLATRVYLIAKNVNLSAKSYSWNVGDVYGTNIWNAVSVHNIIGDIGAKEKLYAYKYVIRICNTIATKCSKDRPVLTIFNPIVTAVPDINIISPNDNNALKYSDSQTINVYVSGNTSQIGSLVNIYIVDADNNQKFIATKPAVQGLNTYSINLKDLNLIDYRSKVYKFYVTIIKDGVIQAYDYTDEIFTVI